MIRSTTIALILAVFLTGCASRELILDVHGAILYEKPEVRGIAYEVADGRREGGQLVVTVRLDGDPGLDASFDITPGVATAEAMREIEDGAYVGRFAFPRDVVGGPFTIPGSVSINMLDSLPACRHPIMLCSVAESSADCTPAPKPIAHTNKHSLIGTEAFIVISVSFPNSGSRRNSRFDWILSESQAPPELSLSRPI